jgi:hypothetical protein
MDPSSGPTGGILLSKKREAAAPERQPSRIYLGPNLSNGRLAHATVFRSGIPAHLQALREKHPDIDTLIVPIEDIGPTQTRITRSGTPENQAYQALERLSRKEG